MSTPKPKGPSQSPLPPKTATVAKLHNAWERQVDEAVNAVFAQKSSAKLVHQLRVTTKHLRGLLQLVRPVVEGSEWRKRDRALRDLAHQLAEARTASVMQKTRKNLNGSDASNAQTTREAAIQASIEAVCQGLAGERDAILQLRPALNKKRLFKRSVAETYRRARQCYRQWKTGRDLEAAHECRKYIKYLMFQTEFLGPESSPRISKTHERLKLLGQTLGDLNDLVDYEDTVEKRDELKQVWMRQMDLSHQGLKQASKLLSRSPKNFAHYLRKAA